MNKELAAAIAAQDSKIFWSIVAAICVSTVVSAIVNYLFNVRLAEAVRRKSASASKLQESKIKIPERTNLLQHEKRITAIEQIAELQRLIQEWEYDHQTVQNPDPTLQKEAKSEFDARWISLNKQLRSLSVYFTVNHSPYLEKYKAEWDTLANSVQEFLNVFVEAKRRLDSGGSGQYEFNSDKIRESANSLKYKIFSDAALYE